VRFFQPRSGAEGANEDLKGEPMGAVGQRLLLIGGSGFLSGTLARLAIERNHKVWAVTRGQRPLPQGVIGVAADRRDPAGLEKAISEAGGEWDLVVDCIAYEPAEARQDIALFGSRARQFVFISTDFVFDPLRRKFPQPEESEHYAQVDGYGKRKRLCELEFIQAVTDGMAWTIFRPCHIYGAGSQLGCLPLHARDPQLIETLRAGRPLQLVGGGHFLQQPILARDLAEMILSVLDNPRAQREIFQAAGPEIIESREYYRIIAEMLGVELRVEEYPVKRFLAEKPEMAPFACHRIYDLCKSRACDLATPATPMREGLRLHLQSLL